MGQEALHLNMTALSEPRLSALDELWAEMGRHCDGTTTVAPPAYPLPWPVHQPEPKRFNRAHRTMRD